MTATATHQATAELEGRAAAVVAAVHAVDVAAAPGTVEAVLVEVAPTPHKRARIVRHLQEHPVALTAGSSATPKLVGALIAALVEAGVTGLVVPTCADCGLPQELFHTLGQERISSAASWGAKRSPRAPSPSSRRSPGDSPDPRPRSVHGFHGLHPEERPSEVRSGSRGQLRVAYIRGSARAISQSDRRGPP